MTDPFLIGVLGMLAITLCWSLAVVLFRVGIKGSTARMLSLLLVVEGMALVTAGYPEFALQIPEEVLRPHVALGNTIAVFHLSSDGMMLALYPAFLAFALQTRLTRPFASKRMRIVALVCGFGVALNAILFAMLLESSSGITVLYFAMMSLFIFAFIAAIDAWRRAEEGIARTRAALFAIAFGFRDVCWGFVYGASFWMSATNTFSPELDLFWQTKFVYALGTLIAVPLIAYGILRAHLLDIDLKLRWTLKQSTFATVVVAISFAISEGVEMLVSAEWGDNWGLVAAAVAVVFLKPLQAFAEKVVNNLMPNTKDTPEYKSSRKIEVYQEAVSEAVYDGVISARERNLLIRLRDSLGVSAAEAEAIENRILVSAAPAG